MQKTLLFFCLLGGSMLAMQSGRLQVLERRAETNSSDLGFWGEFGVAGGLAMLGTGAYFLASGPSRTLGAKRNFRGEMAAALAFVESCGPVCAADSDVLYDMIGALEKLREKHPLFMNQECRAPNGAGFLYNSLCALLDFKKMKSDTVMSEAQARAALKKYREIINVSTRISGAKDIEDLFIRSFALVLEQPVSSADVYSLLLNAMKDLQAISRIQGLEFSSAEPSAMHVRFAEALNQVFAGHIASVRARLDGR